MIIPAVASVGRAPAQVERAARFENCHKSANGSGYGGHWKMHNDGFAKHVRKGAVLDFFEVRQSGSIETNLGIETLCFRKQAIRRIVAGRSKAVPIEPCRIATAAAADVCRHAVRKESPHESLKIRRRGLRVPFGGESCCTSIICVEGFLVQFAPPLGQRVATKKPIRVGQQQYLPFAANSSHLSMYG